MRSHLAKSTVAVAMFVALFARVPVADAQVRSLYMPGMNTLKAPPPEAGLTYAVIVVIPGAFAPLTTITFGRIAAAAAASDSRDAPVVLASRSDRQEATPLRLRATGSPTIYVTGNCRSAQPGAGDCVSSSTNVIVSAIIRF